MEATQPDIRSLPQTLLTGMRLTMSFAQNRTGELWRRFMPRRREIYGVAGKELYSVEIYKPGFFDAFDPAAVFEKWAAVAVTAAGILPDGMASLTIPAGLYAVFIYKGPASAGGPFYQYIFTQWLPASDYILDDRPHFALMGEQYKNEDPDSEEELWIPVEIKR